MGIDVLQTVIKLREAFDKIDRETADNRFEIWLKEQSSYVTSEVQARTTIAADIKKEFDATKDLVSVNCYRSDEPLDRHHRVCVEGFSHQWVATSPLEIDGTAYLHRECLGCGLHQVRLVTGRTDWKNINSEQVNASKKQSAL